MPSNRVRLNEVMGIADRGWPCRSANPEIGPEAARMVTHSLIGEMLRLSFPFDLRLLVKKAFSDRPQWKDGEAESERGDLIYGGHRGTPGRGQTRRRVANVAGGTQSGGTCNFSGNRAGSAVPG